MPCIHLYHIRKIRMQSIVDDSCYRTTINLQSTQYRCMQTIQEPYSTLLITTSYLDCMIL